MPGKPGVRARVEVEDALIMRLHLAGGALGTAELTSVAMGSEDELLLAVNGDRRALGFDPRDRNWLHCFDGPQGLHEADHRAEVPGTRGGAAAVRVREVIDAAYRSAAERPLDPGAGPGLRAKPSGTGRRA